MRWKALVLGLVSGGWLAIGPSPAVHAGELGSVRRQVSSPPRSSSSSRGSAAAPSRPPTTRTRTPSSSTRAPSSGRAPATTRRTRTVVVDPGLPPPPGWRPHPCCRTSHAVLPAPQLATLPRYNKTPYEAGADGFVRRVPRDAAADEGRMWSAQVDAEAGYLGNKIAKAGFGFSAEYWRIGIASDMDWLVEGWGRDAMYLGSTNGRLTVIMRPRLRLRIGGGAQYMVDGRDPRQGKRDYAAGPNATADVELFPLRPLTLSARVDYGRLYKTPSALAQATVGLVHGPIQLYAGYEARAIGTVRMHGPIAGLRAWF